MEPTICVECHSENTSLLFEGGGDRSSPVRFDHYFCNDCQSRFLKMIDFAELVGVVPITPETPLYIQDVYDWQQSQKR